MKKIISIALILVLALAIAVPAFADEPIVVSSSAKRVNGKIVVSVSMDADSKAASGKFTINFPDTVTFDSWENKNLFEGLSKPNSSTPGRFSVVFAGLTETTNGGEVFTATFTPRTSRGKIDFDVTCIELIARDTTTLIKSVSRDCSYEFGKDPINVTTSAAYSDGKITVTVRIDPNCKAISAKFTLTYPDTLAYHSWQNLNVFGGIAKPKTDIPNQFTIAFVGAEEVTNGGDAFSVTFVPSFSDGTVGFGLRCDELIAIDGTTQIPTYVTGCTFTLAIYTVKFVDWNNTVLSEVEVPKGEDAQAPNDPTRSGYVFAGWEGSYTNVTSDRTIKATYWQVGDVNRDGTINTGDAATVLRYCVGYVEFDDVQMILADFNGDGNVNTGDAVSIINYCVGD